MKCSPLPWEIENVQLGPERSAYYVVKDDDGKIIFDSLNSDVQEIHEEADDGAMCRWDEQARKDLGFACHAANNHQKMLAALKAVVAWAIRSNVICQPEDIGMMDRVKEAIVSGEIKKL